MPKVEEHSKKILRLRKGEGLLVWILHKIVELVFFFFSANVHQCNIAFSAVHAQVCLKSFFNYLLFISLSCRPGQQPVQLSLFVLPVGLYE